MQNIEPKMPKHSSIKELQKRIELAISEGYSKVFCVIDMDNKKEGKDKTDYESLKRKYRKPVVKVKKGINCEVKFFETERCTELFFLYYFRYTTKEYICSDDLVKELNKECGYLKEQKFFARHPLHQYFIKKGGSLDNAIANSEKSCKSIETTERDCTYSQLGNMIELLKKK